MQGEKGMSRALKGGILSKTKNEVVEYISSVDQDSKILKQLFDINTAHTLMLIEEKILERSIGSKIIKALHNLRYKIKLDNSKEDAYVCIEDEISRLTGDAIGGNLWHAVCLYRPFSRSFKIGTPDQ